MRYNSVHIKKKYLSILATIIGIMILGGIGTFFYIKKHQIIYVPFQRGTNGVEDRSILTLPSPDASNKEREAHYAKTVGQAKTSFTLDVTGCKMSPLVLMMQEGKKITLENKDDKSHILRIDRDYVYTVPANGKTEITFDFGRGYGLYGYGCDSGEKTSGFFLVTEKDPTVPVSPPPGGPGGEVHSLPEQ